MPRLHIRWMEVPKSTWQTWAKVLKSGKSSKSGKKDRKHLLEMIRSEYKLYEEADIAVDRYQHNGNHKTVLVKMVQPMSDYKGADSKTGSGTYDRMIQQEITLRRAAQGTGLFLSLLDVVSVSGPVTFFVFNRGAWEGDTAQELNMAGRLLANVFSQDEKDPLSVRLGGNHLDPLNQPLAPKDWENKELENESHAEPEQQPVAIFKQHIVEAMFELMTKLTTWLSKQGDKLTAAIGSNMCTLENLIWEPETARFRFLDCVGSVSCTPIPVVDLMRSLATTYSAVLVQNQGKKAQYRIMIGLSERFAAYTTACNAVNLEKWKRAHAQQQRVGGAAAAFVDKSNMKMRAVLMQRLPLFRL